MIGCHNSDIVFLQLNIPNSNFMNSASFVPFLHSFGLITFMPLFLARLSGPLLSHVKHTEWHDLAASETSASFLSNRGLAIIGTKSYSKPVRKPNFKPQFMDSVLQTAL